MEQESKIIYYTVEIELDYFDEIGTTNGLKTISMYTVKNNKLIGLGELKSKIGFYSSEEEISDYIDEFLPEYNSNLIELVRL
jgi:hypothetical protein